MSSNKKYSCNYKVTTVLNLRIAFINFTLKYILNPEGFETHQENYGRPS